MNTLKTYTKGVLFIIVLLFISCNKIKLLRPYTFVKGFVMAHRLAPVPNAKVYLVKSVPTKLTHPDYGTPIYNYFLIDSLLTDANGMFEFSKFKYEKDDYAYWVYATTSDSCLIYKNSMGEIGTSKAINKNSSSLLLINLGVKCWVDVLINDLSPNSYVPTYRYEAKFRSDGSLSSKLDGGINDDLSNRFVKEWGHHTEIKVLIYKYDQSSNLIGIDSTETKITQPCDTTHFTIDIT